MVSLQWELLGFIADFHQNADPDTDTDVQLCASVNHSIRHQLAGQQHSSFDHILD
jgi:hypothetical protein